MLKRTINQFLWVFTLIVTFFCKPSFAEESWIRMEHTPFGEIPQIIRSASPHSTALFLAGQNSLFLSQDNGKSWNRTFRSGWGNKINRVEIENHPLAIYACTANGLYQSSDEGKSWKELYRGLGEKNRNVLSFARNPFEKNTMYIGTSSGVFLSKDNGKTWARAFAEIARKQISDIKIDSRNDEIYFVADSELYRYHILQDSFRKVFSESLSVSETETDMASSTDEENGATPSSFPNIRIAFSNHPKFPIVIGTKKGIFSSDDEGETWREFSMRGIERSPLIDLVYSERANTLFSATSKKIFRYNSVTENWEELYAGLTSAEVLGLAIERGRGERLFAATRNGLFSYKIDPYITMQEFAGVDQLKIQKLTYLLALEPNVREIQKRAVEYANVGNGKIKRWQAGSRIRAFIPDITFSKGLDVSNNLHVDTGSTTTPDNFVQGPDQRGKSTDVSLKWSLGDLIFNSAQTSIDSREKLMVELRDEILNEVTRLYFERRNSQIDFLTHPPENSAERAKALLRIEELTANLDALTNGYLSKQLERLSKKHPELAELWETALKEALASGDSKE